MPLKPLRFTRYNAWNAPMELANSAFHRAFSGVQRRVSEQLVRLDHLNRLRLADTGDYWVCHCPSLAPRLRLGRLQAGRRPAYRQLLPRRSSCP